MHISVYLLGSFRAFDYALQHFNDSLGLNYGRLTFAGIDELIGRFFNIFRLDYPIMNGLSGALTAPQINIGKNIDFNALYTCVFNFFFDFGVVGVFLFPFLFGIFYRKIILNFEHKGSRSALFMLLFVSISSIFSVLTWKYQAPAAIIVLFGSYLFGYSAESVGE